MCMRCPGCNNVPGSTVWARQPVVALRSPGQPVCPCGHTWPRQDTMWLHVGFALYAILQDAGLACMLVSCLSESHLPCCNQVRGLPSQGLQRAQGVQVLLNYEFVRQFPAWMS